MHHTGQKTLGTLLSESFEILTQKAYPLFILTAVLYIPLGVLHVLSMTNVDPSQINQSADPAVVQQYVVGRLMYAVIATCGFFLYQIAVFLMIQDIDRAETAAPMEYFKKASSFFGAYFFVFILVTVKVFLWTLLLVIPGMIFAALYSFASLAVVLDGYRGNEALAFSKSLIRPRFWQFVGYTFVVLLIMIAASSVIQVGVSILFGSGVHGNVGLIARTGEGIAGLLSGFVAVYGSLFSYLLYHEFKTGTAVEPSTTPA